MKFLCPVCNIHSFSEADDYSICPVCGWENDIIQFNDFDYWGGANDLSVNELRMFRTLLNNTKTQNQVKEYHEVYISNVKKILKYPVNDIYFEKLRSNHDNFIHKLETLLLT